MKVKTVVKGILTFVPGLENILPSQGTGGTDSSEYCYGVWFKHLTNLWESGLRSIPNSIAELGPGDSLGVGLAAMLSGVNNYCALDVVRYSNTEFNLRIFDELVDLFKRRAGRPSKGWPDYDEFLDEHLFPSHILTKEVLEISLSQERIERIRKALENLGTDCGEISIKYMAPWADDCVIQKETVDLIISHSVLEHITDMENTYQALYLWLKQGGMMSHQIDFKSHGLSEKWDGHRAISEWMWKIAVGKRKFLINREPHSVHLEMMRKNNFKIVLDLKRVRTDGIQRSELSKKWKDLSAEDLTCSGALIQACKE